MAKPSSTLLRSLLLRQNLLTNTNYIPSIINSSQTLISSSPKSPSQPFTTTTPSTISHYNPLPSFGLRTLCSSSGPSNIMLIKSDEEFNSSLKKVQDESLPAIFYFTAAWCGPCRFIAPIISKWSETYPHVTTYKIDIDEVELQNTLKKLNIASVPTLHFYHKGKKESEVIGADLARLNATVERLYK